MKDDFDYDRQEAQQMADCKVTLSHMPNFIEEALANEPYDTLIAALLRGENANLVIWKMVNDYADHCILKALEARKGPSNIGDSLQDLKNLYS